MAQKGYWSGFGWGLLAGAGGIYALMTAAGRGASTYNSRILRLERSIEVAAAPEEVFSAWQSLENLPGAISILQSVSRRGSHSHWVVNADGRMAEFDAETTQFIPGQAMGWKSVTGPKHSGRVLFAPLGNDTVVHVTMNYSPPLGRFNFLTTPATEHLESLIDRALRDFKLFVEGGRGGFAGRSHEHRQFSMTAPRQDENEGATRRDLLEADGTLLENIRGGRQRVDRRRIDADRQAMYSPTETDFGQQSSSHPPHSGTGPQSAGWDETAVNQEQPSAETENKVRYTRPPEQSYPSGLTPKEREDPYSAHGEKEREDKAS
jgi:uncharacterized membrane protein